MGIDEFRLWNARYLADSVGGIGIFAREIHRKPGQLSQTIGKTRTKVIGNGLAHQIEDFFGLERYWMDYPRPKLWITIKKKPWAEEIKEIEKEGFENHILYSMDSYIPAKILPIYAFADPEKLPDNHLVMVEKMYPGSPSPESLPQGDYFEEIQQYAYRSDWIKNSAAKSSSLSVVEVLDNSMLPTLSQGDLVLIDMKQKIIENGNVYIIELGGDYIFRRLFKTMEKIILHSDNTKDPEFMVDEELPINEEDSIQIFGRAVNRTGSGSL